MVGFLGLASVSIFKSRRQHTVDVACICHWYKLKLLYLRLWCIQLKSWYTIQMHSREMRAIFSRVELNAVIIWLSTAANANTTRRISGVYLCQSDPACASEWIFLEASLLNVMNSSSSSCRRLVISLATDGSLLWLEIVRTGGECWPKSEDQLSSHLKKLVKIRLINIVGRWWSLSPVILMSAYNIPVCSFQQQSPYSFVLLVCISCDGFALWTDFSVEWDYWRLAFESSAFILVSCMRLWKLCYWRSLPLDCMESVSLR